MREDDDLLIGIGPDGELYPVPAPRSVVPTRGRGALLGLAVGDALGTTLEFSSPQVPPLPRLLDGPHREMTGGGPFRLPPGQVTDDTQMACCLKASLMANGQLEPEDVGRRYVAWMSHAFDVGNQIGKSLRRIAQGIDPLTAGRQVWEDSGRQAAGNGSLMRTVPIGLFSADLHQNRRVQSLLDSAITHFDPRCGLACAAFNAAVAVGCTAGGGPPEMAEAARAELQPSSAWLLEQFPDAEDPIRKAVADLTRDLDAAAAADPQLYGPELHLVSQAGFVRVAFRLAFWHLLHTPSFEAALVDVVNRGGDADTNGAITGALLGSYLGEEAIPGRWRTTVLDALQDDPAAASPLATIYHPRSLLELIRER